MIAYNHYIKFIPELKNDKKVEGSFIDVITVKESSIKIKPEMLNYKIIFTTNQNRDLALYSDREFSRKSEGQLWSFEIKDVMILFWHSGSLSLEYIKYGNFTEELLEYWCLHIILPIFFTVEEKFDFLHAGAIEIDNSAILFIAESFGGKSTLTDFFMKQGHTMMSDDKVGIYQKDGQCFAISSHPHHRPYRKVEDLGFYVENISSDPKPIHVIYELEKVEEDAEILITELKGVKKFLALRQSSEMNLFFLKPNRFEFLMKMASIVPVYKITVPWNLKRLNEVRESILKHANRLKMEEII